MTPKKIATRTTSYYECPGCHWTLEEREGVFWSRHIGFCRGLVCPHCNALWEHPEAPFLELVYKTVKAY